MYRLDCNKWAMVRIFNLPKRTSFYKSSSLSAEFTCISRNKRKHIYLHGRFIAHIRIYIARTFVTTNYEQVVRCSIDFVMSTLVDEWFIKIKWKRKVCFNKFKLYQRYSAVICVYLAFHEYHHITQRKKMENQIRFGSTLDPRWICIH